VRVSYWREWWNLADTIALGAIVPQGLAGSSPASRTNTLGLGSCGLKAMGLQIPPSAFKCFRLPEN
jgi:hypothetical protein